MSRLAAALLLLAGVAGCATKPVPAAVRTLRVAAAPDANAVSGTDVDLVFVFEPEAQAALPPTAALWFASRQALRAGQPTMAVLALHVPADYALTAIDLPAGYRKAIGVYAFASYVSPAALAQCKLTPFVHVVLRLHNDHLECAGE